MPISKTKHRQLAVWGSNVTMVTGTEWSDFSTGTWQSAILNNNSVKVELVLDFSLNEEGYYSLH